MNITTSAQDFEMSDAIDQFARQHVRSALRPFSDDILAVDVFMKDTNGPKGGVDKQALIRIRLRNRSTIALQTEHESLYGAIKKGAKRVKRTVRRQLRKARRIDKRRLGKRLIVSGMPAGT
ncbi:MAG: HPF/RaiA family ribosome-associated protein [Gammaproteobacteria bacterium]|nr:HPF/RaiA family ribosome-associated protein [Gammaproteobacteria bacterium]